MYWELILNLKVRGIEKLIYPLHWFTTINFVCHLILIVLSVLTFTCLVFKFSLFVPDWGIKTQNCAFCGYYIWDTLCPSGTTSDINWSKCYLIYHKYYFFPHKNLMTPWFSCMDSLGTCAPMLRTPRRSETKQETKQETMKS